MANIPAQDIDKFCNIDTSQPAKSSKRRITSKENTVQRDGDAESKEDNEPLQRKTDKQNLKEKSKQKSYETSENFNRQIGIEKQIKHQTPPTSTQSVPLPTKPGQSTSSGGYSGLVPGAVSHRGTSESHISNLPEFHKKTTNIYDSPTKKEMKPESLNSIDARL